MYTMFGPVKNTIGGQTVSLLKNGMLIQLRLLYGPDFSQPTYSTELFIAFLYMHPVIKSYFMDVEKRIWDI